jgi:hypothetical protein
VKKDEQTDLPPSYLSTFIPSMKRRIIGGHKNMWLAAVTPLSVGTM